MKNRWIIWAMSLVMLFALAQTATAWNQGTHRQINSEAVQLFLSQMEGKEKYQLGPITEELRQKPYRGIAAASSGLYVQDYQSALGNYTMPQWITLGGDWADEPHLYSSLRHFYDPFSRVKPYLTDQWLVHGVLYESPGIDAKTWGLDHPDNPFCFKQGLTYYKLAMEVREDVPPPGDPMNNHFKTNLILDPVDPGDQREYFLAMAYRALGETMHMLGDMTQPAHVRNDAHPLDEPIESRVFSEHVRNAAADPLLDPRITPFLASAGGGLQWPEQLFDVVAAFTNKYFYSADTIYDQPSLVIPNNYSIFALPYSEPQFADLQERYTRVQGYLIERRVKRYEGQGGAFEWTTVPMAQERLSFHWFDPDQSIWIDAKEVAGRFGGNHGRYHIPNAYAPHQARVLLPIAIYANADLMDMFFPTMELTATFINEGIQQGDIPDEDYYRYVINVDADMVHHQQRDPAWSEYDLLIEYTGPAALIISEDEKPVRQRKLHFIKGKIDKIEMPDGTLSPRDLELYATLGERTLTEEEAFYLIADNQSVHVEIKAGTRHFQSDPWLFEAEEPTVAIMPPRIMTYEMAKGATEVTHDFEASGTPDDLYRFEWDFDDGTTYTDTPGRGEHSKVSHTYTNLSNGDQFYPSVRIFTLKGYEVLAVDQISIRIQGDSDVFSYNCGWSPDYSKLRPIETAKELYYQDSQTGKRHGLYLSYDTPAKDLVTAAGCYNQDAKHGSWTGWFWGSGALRSQTEYDNGVAVGTHIDYYEAGKGDYHYTMNGGKFNQHEYANNLRNGTSIRWYPNGQKEWEYQYKDGMQHGSVTIWYMDGSLWVTGSYFNNQRSGAWIWYNKDGTISRQQTY